MTAGSQRAALDAVHSARPIVARLNIGGDKEALAADIIDLWTGVVGSPVAIMLRDKSNYVDLTGLSRLRAIVRTLALHVIHPAVKLADGTYLAGSRAFDTEGEYIQEEVRFGGMRWHKLDPQKVVTTIEVPGPDLTRVDEVGFVDLAPGGGHGIAGAFNVSTFELYAKGVPR